MSEKFNSGVGAVICDGCSVILLEVKRHGGGFKRTVNPVVLAARDPDVMGLQRDFCSVACAHAFCQDPNAADPGVKAEVCRVLVEHYKDEFFRQIK